MTLTAQATAYWTPTPADLPRVEDVARFYWDSVDAPQRFWAVEAVSLIDGVESVLDVGCQSGPTLRAIRRIWPGIALHGLDVNPWAIDAGRRFMHEAGYTDVTLQVGAMPEALTTFADASIDVVLSTYALAYLGPVEVVTAITEMLRIARKGLVLIEPMVTADRPPDEHTVAGTTYVEWRHDYLNVLSQAADRRPEIEEIRVAILPRQRVSRLNGVLVVTKGPRA